jgi:hypothetical protein
MADLRRVLLYCGPVVLLSCCARSRSTEYRFGSGSGSGPRVKPSYRTEYTSEDGHGIHCTVCAMYGVQDNQMLLIANQAEGKGTAASFCCMSHVACRESVSEPTEYSIDLSSRLAIDSEPNGVEFVLLVCRETARCECVTLWPIRYSAFVCVRPLVARRRSTDIPVRSDVVSRCSSTYLSSEVGRRTRRGEYCKIQPGG